MSNRRLLIPSFVCALVVAVSAPCFADTDALTDKAGSLYDEGMAAYGKSKWAEARASFLAAWALKKHWQIAGSLGDCEAQLGLHRDAAEHLAFFLRLAPSERRSEAAKRLLTIARSKVGTLVVDADAPDTQIVIDGRVVGKTPLEDPIFVEPGHHEIVARLGAKVAIAKVDIGAGAEKSLKLVVTAVTEDPGKRRPSIPVVVSGGVLSVAGIVSGVALLALAGSTAGRADAQLANVKAAGKPCTNGSDAGACGELHALNARSDTLHNIAIPVLAAGGALAAGTLVYALWPRAKAEPAAAVRPLPVVGPGRAGLWVNVTF